MFKIRLKSAAIVTSILTLTLLLPAQAWAAYSPPSSSFYKSQYGFYGRTTSTWYANGIKDNLASHTDAFLKEKALAIRFAPQHGIDPVLPVWWTYAETNSPGNRYYSYGYSNCEGAPDSQKYRIDRNCESPQFGGWQIGFGQQFAAIGHWHLLYDAFTAVYGNPNDSYKVRRVGQRVLNKSGIDKTFPRWTIDTIVARSNIRYMVADNYWAYTIMRDPAISMYMLSTQLYWDVQGGRDKGQLFRDVAFSWDYYYYSRHWQRLSNLLYDVIHLWKVND